jgi:hypothetical protein
LHEADVSQIEFVAISQNEFVARSDAREGAMALIEKRAPKFERLGKRDG